MLVEHTDRDDGGGGGAGHGLTQLVHEEHAIRVAVEREPDIRAHLQHARLQIAQVLGLEGIGRMVREGAVELAVQHLELHGEAVEHGGDHQAAHAVRRVSHHLERAERGLVDEGPHVGGERAEQIERRRAALGTGGRGTPMAAIRLISWRPESSPMGRAPARQSLSPLY